MIVFQVVGTTLLSLAVLFLLSKLMGYKQLAQMNMFDYITGITIGSIAAEVAVDKTDWWLALIAMVIYGLVAWSISCLTNHSIPLRRWFSGHCVLLYKEGKFYRQALAKAKLDVNSFLAECRAGGWFDLSQLQLVMLEPTGRLSFQPYAAYRPVTPSDLSLSLVPESAPYYLILDGELQLETLRRSGRDLRWLDKALRAEGVRDIAEIFLASVDDAGTLHIYRQIAESPK